MIEQPEVSSLVFWVFPERSSCRVDRCVAGCTLSIGGEVSVADMRLFVTCYLSHWISVDAIVAFESQFSCSTRGRLRSDGTCGRSLTWLGSGESDGTPVDCFSCLDASFESCSGRGVDFFSVILFFVRGDIL